MRVVIGLDPSFTAFGVSDGVNHGVIKTAPRDSDPTQAASIQRRCREIVRALDKWGVQNHPVDDLVYYIEAPSFGSASMASHLYELGWLMSEIHGSVGQYIEKVVEVPPTTLRKWATGKGNTKKDAMKLAVYKKFGVEFENDPGCDKLFAFLLCKFGEAVEAGEVEFKPSSLRGQNRRKT